MALEVIVDKILGDLARTARPEADTLEVLGRMVFHSSSEIAELRINVPALHQTFALCERVVGANRSQSAEQPIAWPPEV